MRVVEVERMAERAIEQRGYGRGPGLAVTEYGGLAGAIQRQRFEHFQQRRRGFGVAPGANRAAEEIQRQHLGALQHLMRDFVEAQVMNVSGERCGFVGHAVSSVAASVGGLNRGFKRVAGTGSHAVFKLSSRIAENDRSAQTARWDLALA